MNILITGGSGFIGNYLINELIKHGYTVRVLTRNHTFKNEKVEIFIGDITDRNSLFLALDGIDAVFHNAAYVGDSGGLDRYYTTNVEGTRNVADGCLKKGINRIVYTSSAGIYGFPNSDKWIDEESPKKPLNAYHKSKLQGELVLNGYKNLHTSIIRPPLVLAAGSKPSILLMSRLKKGTLTFIGSGKQHIPLAHPADVAQCLRLSLEKDHYFTAYNCVSFICRIDQLFGEIANQMNIKVTEKHIPYSIAYTVAIISEFFSENPKLTRFRVKSFGTSRKICCDKAKVTLGYEPKFNLQSTVEDMLLGSNLGKIKG